jgi:hypothetical protein
MEPTFIPIMGMLTGIIINLGLFTTIILAVYFSTKARNRERMALIEKGVDVSEIYKRNENPHGFFKFGIVIIGIAVGLVFSHILVSLNVLPHVIAYFSMILLFGGVAVLVANHLVSKKQTQQ